jgi:hypothetical protein
VAESVSRVVERADEFFMQRGPLHQTLRRLTRDLDEAAIPYALLGAIALGSHGLSRMTADIDILLTPQGLAAFRARYEGRGYIPAFSGAAKSFQATDTGVRIEVLTTGEYPGDGLPKPVRFPDPQEAYTEIDGTRIVRLERLIELKLASGMTAAHRRRDLADVLDLIRAVKLPQDLAGQLDASVRELYLQLWRDAQARDALQEDPL